MTKLIRSGTSTGSANKLIGRILERSELASAVRELSGPVLEQVIDYVGLEDAAEIVALASTQQLTQVWDRDLWTRDERGAPERFDPERFGLWLSVLLEAGEQQLVERLCALPIGTLTLAFHRLLRVVDRVQWSRALERDPDESTLHAAWNELVLIARDEEAWDAAFAALLALDEHDHALVRELLERCCDLDFVGSALDSDEVGERSEDAVLERDVAAERQARRTASGYVTASDARAFLRLASEPTDQPAVELARDAITNAYFREVGTSDQAPAPAAAPETGTSISHTSQEQRAGLGALLTVLADSGIVVGPSELVRAQLPAGEPRAVSRGHAPSGSLLQRALSALQERWPAVWDERMAELAYLANVLLADARPGELDPRQALERASEVCNAGLLAELPEAQHASERHALELLRAVSADRLFRAGYRAARA